MAKARIAGQKIAKRREELGMSPWDLCLMIRIYPAVLSKIENGHTNPTIATIYPICRALDSPIEDFVEENRKAIRLNPR